MTLSGCAKTITQEKIVNVDSFCTGKYTPLYFSDEQWERIVKEDARKEGTNQCLGKNCDILDIYIRNHFLNGKEYKLCPTQL